MLIPELKVQDTADDYPIFFEMEEKWYRSGSNDVCNRQFLVQNPDGYLLRFFQDLGERSSHGARVSES